MIHKYGETLDDINRLEEVTDLSAAINDIRRQEKRLIDKGIEQGAFDMALKVKDAFGWEGS